MSKPGPSGSSISLPIPCLYRPRDSFTPDLQGGQCQGDWLPDHVPKAMLPKPDAGASYFLATNIMAGKMEIIVYSLNCLTKVYWPFTVCQTLCRTVDTVAAIMRLAAKLETETLNNYTHITVALRAWEKSMLGACSGGGCSWRGDTLSEVGRWSGHPPDHMVEAVMGR